MNRSIPRSALALVLCALMLITCPALADEAGALSEPTTSGMPDDSPYTTENSINNLDELARTLGLNEEERELLTELDPSEQIIVEDGDLSIREGLGDGWRNILLLGNDSRSLDDNGRTDTMIIASINQQTGEIKLTSIMRDTAVNIPGRSAKNKINSAYRYGGPNLAMKTVNEAFDMNISEYVVVNLASFADIIDSIGGIEMDVTEGEMKHVNNILNYYKEDAEKNGIAEGEDFSELHEYGENIHLTGQQALAYARIRKLDTDYKRTERQRDVLVAIANKLSTQSVSELVVTALNLWGSVRTNLSFFDAIQLGMKGASAISGGVEQFRIPADGTFKSGTFDGRWEIRPDFDENIELLHEFIYGE